jgi:uncharacterized RDD family membrane protein YckC
MEQLGDRTGISPGAASSRPTATPFGRVQPIDSPEQVRLELEIAGPMSRAFAFSIDYSLILLLMAMGFLILVSGLGQIFSWASEIRLVQEGFARLLEWLGNAESSGERPLWRGLALSLAVWVLLELTLTTLYFLCFELLWDGRTPGKRMTHLRVVREGGARVGWRDSLLRNLMRAVDSLPTGYLLGLVAIIVSPRGQRLGDLVAGTLVVRERASQSSEVAEMLVVDPDVEAGFRFTRDELAAIGEIERRLIRRTLRRTETLSERAAGPLLERAVSALLQRIGRREAPASPLRRDFLVALLRASERLL